MPDNRSETRWTAYNGLYPVAHAASKEGVLHIARTRGRDVTHVVLRERAYPFKHIRQEKPMSGVQGGIAENSTEANKSALDEYCEGRWRV
jgi:hypothetical protein